MKAGREKEECPLCLPPERTIKKAASDVGAEEPFIDPEMNPKGGKGSKADVSVEKEGRILIQEKKFQLPKWGEPLTRVREQLKNMEMTADLGVLELAKLPKVKELANFIQKQYPKVRQAIKQGRIKIVTSPSELYNIIIDFFK